MLPIYFYSTFSGKEPVREWLKSLPLTDRKAIGEDIKTIQIGWQSGCIGMPLVRSLKDGLFEIRTHLPSNRIARVFFCIEEEYIILLHGFIKKTQYIPADMLKLARKRKGLYSIEVTK